MHVAGVRRFNRFYTRAIGILDETYLEPGFSLTAGRVLYELAQSENATAARLRQDLRLDAGYLSRILKDFRRRGLVEAVPSPQDRRTMTLRLTDEGRRTFERLAERSDAEIAALLQPLDAAGRGRLLGAMREIETLLTPIPQPPEVTLRPPRAGDFGWVVERHGALYAAEYGWDERFEALVAGIVADFIRAFDPARERCWIAERDGTRVGSAFVARQDEGTAKLRLLLVDPAARGCGLGRRLVAECLGFAREAGYRRMTLWTQQNLVAARRIYAEAGFECVASEPYDGIGRDLVSEVWTRNL